MSRIRLWWLIAAFIPVLTADGSQTEQVLPSPSYLSPLARSVLRQRMQRHGQTMRNLALSVVLLRHADAASQAREIAGEPRLARPIVAGESDLNASLPPAFFELQDQLARSAGRLAKAAESGDDASLAAEYGQLSATCIECHTLYLRGPR